jgi:V8-like Glu-specific endopeptidase
VTTPSQRIAAAACVITLAGLFGVAAPHAEAAPRSHPGKFLAERAVVTPVQYWTRARMAAARDVSSTARVPRDAGRPESAGSTADSGDSFVFGARWAGGGAVTRTTGRIFFTLDGTDYGCSGSAVASANASVVMTAAHCVSDGDGGWATHWIFVPGYRDGHEPYGSYPARTYFVADPWEYGADEDDDVAFVVVGPAKVNGAERRVAKVVGSQPVEFGSRGAIQTVFGYPSQAPYDGHRLDYCAGMLLPDPYGAADAGVECTMTAGDSGGPWFTGFNPVTGRGTITGVTTFRYANDSLTLYSANLGSAARGLYEKAQHAPW